VSIRAGMTPPVLNRLEKGETDPRWSTIVRVSSALGMPLPDLLAGTAERVRTPRLSSANLKSEIRSVKRKLQQAATQLSQLEEHLDS
jgi:transcriptional regulator with XRE-family HTH domain